MHKARRCPWLCQLVTILCCQVMAVVLFAVCAPAVFAVPQRILAVMSYEQDFEWVREVREGIESELRSGDQVEYFYLNTKQDFAGGPARAKLAYEHFLATRPDGVLAVDDNAQAMFVVPYLKDKVNTPVIFCGVNGEPEKYGYPATNVTGVLERQHFAEAIALMKQILPNLQRVAFMMKASPTADLIVEELRTQEYVAEVAVYATPDSVEAMMQVLRELKATVDAIYITNLTGLMDTEGNHYDDTTLIPRAAEEFGKPLFSGSTYNIRLPGVLVAVAKTGQEQGSTAMQMLYRALSGVPVVQIPVTRNRFGKRIVNISAWKHFGLEMKPELLRSVKLVTAK